MTLASRLSLRESRGSPTPPPSSASIATGAVVVVRVSNRGLACIEGDSNTSELRTESVREALVFQRCRDELPKLRIRRCGPSREHLEGGCAEAHSDGSQPEPDSLDERLAAWIPSRGSRGIARTREALVQPSHHGSCIVKSAEPRLTSQRTDHGGPVKVAIHPRVNLGEQPVARSSSGSSEGVDHGVPHPKPQIVRDAMKLGNEARAHLLVVRRPGPERADSANREKLESGGSRRFVFIEPGQGKDHAVCLSAPRPALLRKRIGERIVRAGPRQPRTAREKSVERRRTAGDRLVESAPERAGSRLGHVGQA
jgi:hypothetical protein